MKDLKKRIEENLKGIIDLKTEEGAVSMGLIKDLEAIDFIYADQLNKMLAED